MASQISYYQPRGTAVEDNEFELVACGRRKPHCWDLMDSDQTATPFGEYPETTSFGADERGTVAPGEETTVAVAPQKKGTGKPSQPLGSSQAMEADANTAIQTALAPHLVHLQNVNQDESLKLMAILDNHGLRIRPGISGTGTRTWRQRGLLHRWLRHWFMPWAYD